MSETKRRNTYLSLFEGEIEGQGPGLRGAEGFPDPGNTFRSLASSQEKAGAALGHATQNFAQTYDSIITTRYQRDEDVRADEMFREWQLQDSQLSGAEADGLYWSNKEKLEDRRTSFIKESPLSQQAAADVFNKHAGSYLNWSMTRMQQQAMLAERESKRKAANSLVSKAAKTPLTTQSMSSMFQIADNLFYDEPELGDEYKNVLTTTMLNAGAFQDPAGTATWVHEHQEDLIRIMGPEKAAAFTKQAEITSRQAMERNITNEMVFNQQKAAEKTRIARGLNDFTIGLALQGKELDNEQLFARAKDIGADYEAILKAQDMYYKATQTKDKLTTSVEVKRILAKTEPLADEDILVLQGAVASGAMSKTAYNMAVQSASNEDVMSKGGLSRQLGIARSALRGVTQTSIANGMGQYDILSLEAEQVIVNATRGKSEEEVIAMVDLSNPNSLLSTLRRQIATQIDVGSTNLNFDSGTVKNDTRAIKARKAASEATSSEEFYQKLGY